MASGNNSHIGDYIRSRFSPGKRIATGAALVAAVGALGLGGMLVDRYQDGHKAQDAYRSSVAQHIDLINQQIEALGGNRKVLYTDVRTCPDSLEVRLMENRYPSSMTVPEREENQLYFQAIRSFLIEVSRGGYPDSSEVIRLLHIPEVTITFRNHPRDQFGCGRLAISHTDANGPGRLIIAYESQKSFTFGPGIGHLYEVQVETPGAGAKNPAYQGLNSLWGP